jgi:uncharacterized damage-inducible protein DinB
MKEFMKLYAIYNKDTNKNIIKFLSNLSEDELNKERNMYYKSLRKLFNHIVNAQWHYINAVKKIANLSNVYSEKERRQIFKDLENSFDFSSNLLKKLDNELIDLIDVLTEERFKIERKNNKIYNGRVVDITVWQYLSQNIIHQTHHRGQIAQVLDEIGVENDFGNVFPYIKDSEKQ